MPDKNGVVGPSPHGRPAYGAVPAAGSAGAAPPKRETKRSPRLLADVLDDLQLCIDLLSKKFKTDKEAAETVLLVLDFICTMGASNTGEVQRVANLIRSALKASDTPAAGMS